MIELENQNIKENKLNVALKFSPENNNINIIIFKCFLQVNYLFNLSPKCWNILFIIFYTSLGNLHRKEVKFVYKDFTCWKEEEDWLQEGVVY